MASELLPALFLPRSSWRELIFRCCEQVTAIGGVFTRRMIARTGNPHCLRARSSGRITGIPSTSRAEDHVNCSYRP
jgi:hypothetical protein